MRPLSRWRKIIPLVLRNFFLSAPNEFYVLILHYVEISPLACKFRPSLKIERYVDLACWREIISPLGCGIGSTKKLYAT